MIRSVAEKLLRRYASAIKRRWLAAIKTIDADRSLALAEAERFADAVMRLSIQAGYKEAEHLLGGVFDPTVSADRFRVERGQLVSRFMTDVRNSPAAFTVGLSGRQVRDLRLFASTLERASLDAIDFGAATVFTTRESRVQVNRVQRAMLQQRSRTIGATEAVTAINLGMDIAVEQTELITGREISRTWVTAADEKVRSSHAAMSGQVRRINQPFISGNGNALMRPGDTNAPVGERANCRCILVTAA